MTTSISSTPPKESQTPPTAGAIKAALHRLQLPFYFLLKGHLYWIVYMVVLVAAVLAAFDYVQFETLSWIVLVEDRNQNRLNIFAPAEAASWIILLIFMVAVICLVIALPMRLMQINQKLSLSELILQTPPVLWRALHSLLIMLRLTFLLYIPAIMLYAVIVYWHPAHERESAKLVVTLAAGIVAVAACFRAFPLFLAPLVGILGSYSQSQTLFVARTIFQRSPVAPFLLLSSAAFATPLVHRVFAQYKFHPLGRVALELGTVTFNLGWLEILVLLLLVWYLVTQLSLLVIQRIIQFESGNFGAPE